jgi:DnaJ-domain-containing protein 1
MPIKSPYAILGVPPTATDAELRAAYRKLVQLHHPDHNQNSPESTRRFEEVQEAYAQALRERKHTPPGHAPPPPPPPHQATDPHIESRLDDLERQVREAQAARERARRAAREAMATETTAATGRKRPTDEELGYYTTDDSFTSILADARSELAQHLAHAQEHPVAKRVKDLIDGLEDLASKLDRH